MSIAAPRKILIIDDDIHILHNVKRMLDRQGYAVAIHDGSPGCINAARQFEPDLMLVDVNMPFLPGDAFVSLFGKQGELLRPTAVLFSAIDEFTLRKIALACGADGYISKTDSALELARKIAGYLRDSDAKLRSAVAEPSQ